MKPAFFYPLAPLLGFAWAWWAPSRPAGPSAFPGQHPPKPPPLPTRLLPPLAAEADGKAALQQWAAHDPAGLCQWLIERGEPPDDEVLVTLFKTWAKQDPDEAFAALLDLPGDFRAKGSVLWGTLNAVLDSPEGLLAAWRWIPLVEEQFNSFIWGDPAWIDLENPREQAELLAQASGKSYSTSLVTGFSRTWAERDLTAAREWVQGLRPELRFAATSGIIEAWSKQDRQGVLEYLATTASTTEMFYAYIPLRKLAETDPEAALVWQEENLGAIDDNATRQIFWNWKTQTGSAAESLDYILQVEDSVLRLGYLGKWTQVADGESVVRAFQSLPANERQVLLGDSNYYLFSEGEGAAAWRAFLADPAQTDVYPGVAASTARSFAYKDPAEALNWAHSLPERLRESSVASVIDVWKSKDPAAAAQAAETLPAGPAKEAALKQLRPERSPFE